MHAFVSQMTSDGTKLSSLVKHEPAIQTNAGLLFTRAAQTSTQTLGVLDGQGLLGTKSKQQKKKKKGSGNRTLINPPSKQNLYRKPVETGQLTKIIV